MHAPPKVDHVAVRVGSVERLEVRRLDALVGHLVASGHHYQVKEKRNEVDVALVPHVVGHHKEHRVLVEENRGLVGDQSLVEGIVHPSYHQKVACTRVEQEQREALHGLVEANDEGFSAIGEQAEDFLAKAHPSPDDELVRLRVVEDHGHLLSRAMQLGLQARVVDLSDDEHRVEGVLGEGEDTESSVLRILKTTVDLRLNLGER